MPDESVSVLAVGSEILDGRVQDTNSRFIAAELASIGIHIQQILICDDRQEDIIKALKFLESSSSIVIVSGGLGPTSDDVTRQAIARYSERGLVFSEEEFNHLKEFFKARGRELNDGHRIQAMFPGGAVRIKNPIGSASGFVVDGSDFKIIGLPGVPIELEAMFLESVEKLIIEHCKQDRVLHSRLFRIFGLPESEVGDRIDALKLSSDIFVSYRAMFPEIQVKLKSAMDEEALFQVADRLRLAIGESYIFSETLEQSFPKVIHELFTKRHKSLATAESCTGGMLGEFLTEVPGSSSYYLGGVLSYSNDVKIKVLGVDPQVLDEFGAVSGEVALQMADGVRRLLNADFGISITGIAGPGGASELKPVGTFFIGFSSLRQRFAEKFFYFSDRARIRAYASFSAMNILKRCIEA